MLVSPVDSDLMIFMGSHDVNWRTENCGKVIMAMNNGRPVDEFQFHPSQKEWILAAAWSKCDDFDFQEDCEV